MREHTFEPYGGRTVENHKSKWPDFLTVIMRRHDAFDIVCGLLGQLRDEGRHEITFSHCGELKSTVIDKKNNRQFSDIALDMIESYKSAKHRGDLDELLMLECVLKAYYLTQDEFDALQNQVPE